MSDEAMRETGVRDGVTRVIGVDPGTNTIGYGLIEQEGSRLRLVDSGVIRAPRRAPLAKRLQVIHEGLLELFRRTDPGVAVVEQVFYGKSVRDALRIGEGRGVALLAAGVCNLPIAEYAPAQVKKAATGTGRARKAQVQEMVRRILRMDHLPSPDAADAIALALCHCHRSCLDRDGVVGGREEEEGRSAPGEEEDG